MHIKEELEKRGLLHQYTDEKIFDMVENGGQKFYFGVDLSADSMTIGNFVALMLAIHVMLKGNTCYLLVGGATSTIGNPSGKDDERPILTDAELAHNQESIFQQFDHLCKNIQNVTGKDLSYHIVNNKDFFVNMNVLDYLKDVGRYMTVNRMMTKDIVKKRITDPNKRISYAEFSYMLIMGYDFYHLFMNEDVTLEVGGSDERDGILSGIELIHKKEGKTAYGITNKLILDSTGKKFGKSEGNAIWLNKEKSSPYFVYQYFMNTTDEDIERFLKLFTLLSFEEIDAIISEHAKEPQKRFGQQQLAKHVLIMIHGPKAAEQAETITNILFHEKEKINAIRVLPHSDIHALFHETGGAIVGYGKHRLIDLLVQTRLAGSNGEAKKMILAGSIYVNENQEENIQKMVGKGDVINGIVLLRKGKKQYKIALFE